MISIYKQKKQVWHLRANVATRPLTSECSNHKDEALSGNLASEKKLEAFEEVLVALLLFQLSLGFLKSGQIQSNLISYGLSCSQ